ncbi:MAG: hypothetical protein A2428_03215 [Bdellovibrionales bacterium RIFOXYC1_FULL_54_43]|nr:MAG: hypothetical protein A2428_03215 [Bdellovibrionales bacterium RIFOXYC1_FULL_54_43]OFZ82691.1 MAG: hypothetical protein A2603_02650 [Bdellovibrionales bacterium RIFOXYD1_FULL_55_31]
MTCVDETSAPTYRYELTENTDGSQNATCSAGADSGSATRSAPANPAGTCTTFGGYRFQRTGCGDAVGVFQTDNENFFHLIFPSECTFAN